MRDEEKKRDFHEKKSRLKVAVALGDCVWGSYWKGEPDARGAVVGTQSLELLKQQVEPDLDDKRSGIQVAVGIGDCVNSR